MDQTNFNVSCNYGTKTDNWQTLEDWSVQTYLKYELSKIRGLEVQAPSKPDHSLWHLPCCKKAKHVKRREDNK